ncbi:hypothetical protein HPB47_000304, partial [Ixodes persulcatus]
GFLSFLSAPLVGALSDVWGRKFFLLVTVFFTCAPIPLMLINTWWYFAMISMSGVFAVTFSVVFAYVADVTDEQDRSAAYGLVSATFAASLVTSPALGAYLGHMYSDGLVVALASAYRAPGRAVHPRGGARVAAGEAPARRVLELTDLVGAGRPFLGEDGLLLMGRDGLN